MSFKDLQKKYKAGGKNTRRRILNDLKRPKELHQRENLLKKDFGEIR